LFVKVKPKWRHHPGFIRSLDFHRMAAHDAIDAEVDNV